jgi:hypothetical protein
MPPAVPLYLLVEQAVADGLPGMSDDALIGAIAAARKLRNRAEWLEVKATEEFARRRWESSPLPERDSSGRWLYKGRAAEFAADELAFELTEDRRAAEERMDLALALRDRLPQMAAHLAAGRLGAHRCQVVHDVTASLSDDDARVADAELSAEAPGLRYDQLRRRAAKLALRLDPESDRRRKDRATRKKARVEKFLEKSGNYAFGARELPVGQILASEAYIRGFAQYLRAHGMLGSLREIEVMIFLDLTQGRDPRARIPGSDVTTQPRASAGEQRHADARGTAGAAGTAGIVSTAGAAGNAGPARRAGLHDGDEHDGPDDNGAGSDDWDGEDYEGGGRGAGDERGGQHEDDGENLSGGGGGPWPCSPPGPGKPGGQAPFPAKISLLVPVGTLLGWSTMPGEAGRDVIDPRTLRDLVRAASHHPATRWCVTIVGEDRRATAHGCARGQHPWTPPRNPPPQFSPTSVGVAAQDGDTGPASHRDSPVVPVPVVPVPVVPAPAAHSAARAARVAELLGRLKVDLQPLARGSCEHQHGEDGYRPSRGLQDLVRARNATCPAPGCGASSQHSDLDHTRAWPDGVTDECNLGPPCRHHHRAKQAPGWMLEQPEPGVFRWRTPSGRTYVTGPTTYDV